MSRYLSDSVQERARTAGVRAARLILNADPIWEDLEEFSESAITTAESAASEAVYNTAYKYAPDDGNAKYLAQQLANNCDEIDSIVSEVKDRVIDDRALELLEERLNKEPGLSRTLIQFLGTFDEQRAAARNERAEQYATREKLVADLRAAQAEPKGTEGRLDRIRRAEATYKQFDRTQATQRNGIETQADAAA